MKVELINLYYPSNRVKFMLSSYALKGYFDKNSILSNKINVNVSNFSANQEPSIIYDYIKRANADVVGFSCYVWNINLVDKVLSMLKDDGEPITILGGPEILELTLRNEGYNMRGDYFILGEGEVKFQRLIEELYYKRCRFGCDIPGIAYYNDEKKLILNNDKSNVDLSKMPLLYSENIVPNLIYDHELVFFETQRGCKYKCKYCVYHGNINGINLYPIEHVIKEIDYLLKEASITSIRIIDASFTSNLTRAKDILKQFVTLKNQGYSIKKLLLEFNFDDSDEEFLKLIAELKKSSKIEKLNNVHFLDKVRSDSPEILDDYTVISGVGIQSFSAESLRSVSRKPVNFDKLNTFFIRCNQLNILLKLDIILGLPFETEQSYFSGLNYILEYIKDTDHTLQLALLQVLPGSLLENMASKYDLIYSKAAPHIVLQTSTMSMGTLARCTKITGLIARIINSALRSCFFKIKNTVQCSSVELIQKIYERVIAENSLKNIKFIKENSIDDDYWGGEIYSDIPSEFLYNTMQDIGRNYERTK